jgi:hypothetical protein
MESLWQVMSKSLKELVVIDNPCFPENTADMRCQLLSGIPHVATRAFRLVLNGQDVSIDERVAAVRLWHSGRTFDGAVDHSERLHLSLVLHTIEDGERAAALKLSRFNLRYVGDMVRYHSPRLTTFLCIALHAAAAARC